jgi:adenylate cyclase class 2
MSDVEEEFRYVLDEPEALAVAARLSEVGELVETRVVMRRHVFDIVPPSPNTWVRLRDAGSHVSLAVKTRLPDQALTREIEVSVSDFDRTLALLVELGLSSRSYQENARTTYRVGDVDVTLDEWPGLDPLIEIESDRATACHVIEQLNLDPVGLTTDAIELMYQRLGIDVKVIESLSF